LFIQGTQSRRLLAVVATFLFTSVVSRPVAAQAADLPPIVSKGFDAYQTNGAAAAIDGWLAGSGFVGQAALRGNLIQGILNVESSFGHYAGYDVLKIVTLGTRVRRVYAIALYDRGPVYIYFDCYHAADGWVLSMIQVNAKASEILPADMLTR